MPRYNRLLSFFGRLVCPLPPGGCPEYNKGTLKAPNSEEAEDPLSRGELLSSKGHDHGPNPSANFAGVVGAQGLNRSISYRFPLPPGFLGFLSLGCEGG